MASSQPAAMRKITIEVPADLLEKAQRATGRGISETVREALSRMAIADVYDQLLALQGKVDFGMSWQELKDDR